MSEEFGPNFITLTDEDGNDIELEYVDALELDGQTYMAFFPVVEDDADEEAAEEYGVKYACEVFADRAYEADGSLRQRGLEGAMITDEKEAIERVVRMVKEGKVKAYTGEDIVVRADSVCVHGDGQKALDFVKALNEAFIENKIKIMPLGK